MPRKKHTPEQVINKLREAEVALAQGSTVAEASRQIGVTEQTFYRWRNEYGGLRIDQVKRLKQLETENRRLQRKLQRAETIITLQKKVTEILGIPLTPLDDDESDGEEEAVEVAKGVERGASDWDHLLPLKTQSRNVLLIFHNFSA